MPLPDISFDAKNTGKIEQIYNPCFDLPQPKPWMKQLKRKL